MTFYGEAASLLAALLWAVAVTLFRPAVEEHGAWRVNLARNTISALLLVVTTVAVGQAGVVLATPAAVLGIVALSGVVGLTLGDTALFAAIGRIGVHRTLLFQTLGPVFAAALAIGFYGEAWSLPRLAGIAVVLAGVACVVAAAPGGGEAVRPDLWGYALAVLAAFGQAAGVVLAKDGLEEMPLLPASLVRLLAATLATALVLRWKGHLRGALAVLASRRALRQVAPPTILGTYVAFLLMMAGIAFAPASVAAVLLSTSPIFSFFLDHWTVGTPITARGLGGTVLAVAGVGILVVAG